MTPVSKEQSVFVILDDHGWFIECQTLAQFEHHIGVFAAYIAKSVLHKYR